TSALPGQLGQRREVALHLAVPLEAADGPLPPALHGVERRLVLDASVGHRRSQVLVLGLDDLVVICALVGQVARSAELPARHGLHRGSSFSLVTSLVTTRMRVTLSN